MVVRTHDLIRVEKFFKIADSIFSDAENIAYLRESELAKKPTSLEEGAKEALFLDIERTFSDAGLLKKESPKEEELSVRDLVDIATEDHIEEFIKEGGDSPSIEALISGIFDSELYRDSVSKYQEGAEEYNHTQLSYDELIKDPRSDEKRDESQEDLEWDFEETARDFTFDSTYFLDSVRGKYEASEETFYQDGKCYFAKPKTIISREEGHLPKSIYDMVEINGEVHVVMDIVEC